jgi:rhomboid protease GluP
LALPYRWQLRLDRLKKSVGGIFGMGGGEQQPRPKICPACGSLVGISATRCHECGTNLTFSIAALSKHLAGLTGLNAPVSTFFLGLNFFMFIVQIMFTMQAGEAGGLNLLWRMNGISSYKLGALYGPSVFLDHQWWRLITAMFLHGGLIHIGFNMLTLIQLGPTLEELYGSSRFLFVYTFTGAFGFLLSAWRGHFSLGASGALLGIIGAILAVTTKRGGAYMRALRSQLLSSLAFLFILGIWGGIGIDNWAHGGGLAAGFALGKIFADREPQGQAEKRRAQILGWLSGLVILASFVLMLLHFRDPVN